MLVSSLSYHKINLTNLWSAFEIKEASKMLCWMIFFPQGVKNIFIYADFFFLVISEAIYCWLEVAFWQPRDQNSQLVTDLKQHGQWQYKFFLTERSSSKWRHISHPLRLIFAAYQELSQPWRYNKIFNRPRGQLNQDPTKSPLSLPMNLL